ncbi:MAG: response regulator transcription factor [Candidatus Obscuribacterales bacterium]|jgi:DNA-binding NarL/FixJ family response regulator|nr:response regulator transcription factor [Candidatus Obscuribacterales bacterium]
MLNSLSFTNKIPVHREPAPGKDVKLNRNKTVVLIAEDLTGMRNHAAELMKRMFPDNIQILEAANGTDCVSLAMENVPDLIIMDIAMPGLNGIKAAQQIWHFHPSMKILFWSQYHREIYVRDMARVLPDDAIHGYILKSESDEKFEYAINCILKHNNPYIDPVVRSIKSRLTKKDESLSEIEYETLVDICLGLTDKAIAKRRHVSVRGVQNRVSILEAKLLKGQNVVARENSGVEVFNTRARAIFEAFKRGLIDSDQLEEMDEELKEWMAADLEMD